MQTMPTFHTLEPHFHFFIHNSESDVAQEIYRQFLTSLMQYLKITESTDKGYKVILNLGVENEYLELSLDKVADSENSGITVVGFSKNNYYMKIVRLVAISYKLKVKDLQLGIVLPFDPNILPQKYVTYTPEYNEMLKKSPLEQGFVQFDEFKTNAVRNEFLIHKETRAAYIVNLDLQTFFIRHNDFENAKEFSYKIADSNAELVAKLDAGLVPTDFYKYFNKSFKIINLSNFDIKHIDRKVFFHPFVYVLGKERRDLNKLPGGGGYADKVRPSENLDGAIKRCLKEEIKIADDYVGAVVHDKIDFDRDKNNVLTPRLLINVFIKEAPPIDIQRTMQRGWHSLEKDVA